MSLMWAGEVRRRRAVRVKGQGEERRSACVATEKTRCVRSLPRAQSAKFNFVGAIQKLTFSGIFAMIFGGVKTLGIFPSAVKVPWPAGDGIVVAWLVVL